VTEKGNSSEIPSSTGGGGKQEKRKTSNPIEGSSKKGNRKEQKKARTPGHMLGTIRSQTGKPHQTTKRKKGKKLKGKTGVQQKIRGKTRKNIEKGGRGDDNQKTVSQTNMGPNTSQEKQTAKRHRRGKKNPKRLGSLKVAWEKTKNEEERSGEKRGRKSLPTKTTGKGDRLN